jgi:putative hydrolase of the HAD superfamily
VSRAVLFDVDGVLVHGMHEREDRRRRWDTHLLADLGVEPTVFVEQFVRKSFVSDVITGRTPLIDELERWLPTVGYVGSPMNFISYWLHRDSQLNQPLLAGIRRLRTAPGVGPLYVATNQEHLRAFHLWSTLGLQHMFDDIFYSARLGATKPDRAFFDAVASRIGLQEEVPLMFDDSVAVVEAARAYGWDAVLYADLEDFTTYPWIAERLSATQPV